MTLTLLDLYNTAATQEWSMYDNDAENKDEFEKSLVLSINKAVTEILYSYPFSFRERTQIFITVPNIDTYDIPSGIIKRDERGDYCIRINSKSLNVCLYILSIVFSKSFSLLYTGITILIFVILFDSIIFLL